MMNLFTLILVALTANLLVVVILMLSYQALLALFDKSNDII